MSKEDKRTSENRSVGLKQIAEETGVSMMTVSRALRGDELVAPETAARIREVAERLRYRPNRLVEGLRTGRTGMVAAMLPSSLGFYNRILTEIEKALESRDNNLLLSLISAHWGKEARQEELRRLHRLVDLRIDGIILRPVNDDANAIYFHEVMERGIPMVVIDRRLPDFNCDYVGTDNHAGGRLAAQHLLETGARRLLVLYAGERVSTSRERCRGFCQAVEESGSDAKVDVYDCNEFHPTPEVLEPFFSSTDLSQYDGLFAVSDHLARAVLVQVERVGLRCPEDIRLVGFGNLPTGDPGSRSLTTIEQFPEEIGRQAVELLWERLAKPKTSPRVFQVPVELIQGSTT